MKNSRFTDRERLLGHSFGTSTIERVAGIAGVSRNAGVSGNAGANQIAGQSITTRPRGPHRMYVQHSPISHNSQAETSILQVNHH